MNNRSPLRPVVIKVSVTIACIAWGTVIMLAIMGKQVGGQEVPLLFAILAWPIGYIVPLLSCWLVAKIVTSVDESYLYGPAKGMQLKLLRGPMVWWINACAILLPAIVLAVILIKLVFR